jgi:hypothetical protein
MPPVFHLNQGVDKKQTQINMKTKCILKPAALSAAIIMAGMAHMNAQSTNLVQNVSFALTFYEQGPTNHPTADKTTVAVNRFGVNTKYLIAAIGSAISNSFSANARLVYVQDITSSNYVSTFEIRDGTNPPVDVSDFIQRTNADIVHGSFYNGATGIGAGVRYSILSLTVTNPAMTASLNLSGFATRTHANIKNHDVVLGVDALDADLAGTGVDTNGIPATVDGTMTIDGHSFDVK